MTMINKTKTARKLTASIAWLIILAVCLAITTFAIVYSMVSIESNLFTTGTLQINLNDGKAVIRQGEHIMEPGATIKKDFFIENQSTCSVYYRLYFQNVSGGLADALIVTICDGDKIIAKGTPTELTRNGVEAAPTPLEIGEKKELQIYFHFPEAAENSVQNQSLSFDFAADAVQVKNNPDGRFD